MADIADHASEYQERMQSAALARRHDTSDRPTPNGECHACGEDVEGERIFCDSACARDWNHEQQRRKANGR